MVPRYLVLFVLLAAMLIGPASIASAQAPPPVPAPGGAAHQPRGPQQPPADLPPEVLNAPYNGPDYVSYDPAELALAQRTGRPSPELVARAQAHQQQNLAQRDILQRMTQRARAGDRTPPTPVEVQQLDPQHRAPLPRHQPGQQPPSLPTPRSETPLGHGMRLLGLGKLAASPAAEPPAAPDDGPSLQSVQNACAVYPLFWDQQDAYDGGIFYAETYHICAYVDWTRIQRTEVSQHLYRCSWYMSAFNICFVPLYYATLYPYCEFGAYADANLCGPRVYDPPWQGAGYFIRSWGNLWTWDGLFGTAVGDSGNIGWHCDAAHQASCS